MKIEKVLYPTDFSEGSRVALSYAETLARDYKGLVLLYVVPDIPAARWYVPPEALSRMFDDLEKSAGQEMEKLKSQVSGVKAVEARIAHGTAYEEIIRTARDVKADMIVIGAHGRRGVDH
jgi:nucleotide-binding universal stress UspA family protein